MHLEDRFSELASLENTSKPSIILCHGGVMDSYALTDESTW